MHSDTIKDRNKGIEGIEYNLLNLPKRILYKQNNAIYYTYDASGVKWAKEIHKDGGIKRFDYLGNFVYEDHVLKYIITDYGKIVISKVNNPFIRYYDLRDHLGNVRASFRANDNNTFTLLQEDSYYPFGMQQPSMNYLNRDTEHKNLHLYNGKELQTDFDLNWYDYGARFYDVELVRWHVVDALAEKFPYLSPYNFVMNNPLRLVDPDGRGPEEVIIVFNKLTMKLAIIDLDHYLFGLPTLIVSAKNYVQGGIRDSNGNLTHNQVLILTNVKLKHLFTSTYIQP